MTQEKMSRLRRRDILQILLVDVVILLLIKVEGKPFPAPNFQNCFSSEGCCPPAVTTGNPTSFKFPTELPMRTRPAAHLLDDAYIAKYQKAYELMRALPDSDGRSHANQAYVHCGYCDNQFYFPGSKYPLEIHNNWLFLPWHRLFLYFHERILAKLIGDDTFALPYWNWDGLPEGMVMPNVYAERNLNNKTNSSLYDPDRNKCAQRPRVVDFSNPSLETCSNVTDEFQHWENAHVIYTQLVTAAVTPSLFIGQPYRYGDYGGVGGGSLEIKPHGAVHIWVNARDMILFKNSATDPIFFAHHANVDRLWTIWKRELEGGIRADLTDPDWLNTQFTFYDEDGKLVSVSVAQALEPDLLRYEYQKVPMPWMTPGTVGVGSGSESANTSTWHYCNKASSIADMLSMIKETEPFQGPMNYSSALTFRLQRPSTSRRSNAIVGEEVLEIEYSIDWMKQAIFNVFLYLPQASWDDTSIGCPEFAGYFETDPHVGQSSNIPRRLVFRAGLRQKLKDLGRESLSHIVVTLVGPHAAQQTLAVTNARVMYLSS